jgi:hypothetical protein
MNPIFHASEPINPSLRRLRDLPGGAQNGIAVPSGSDRWYHFAEAYLQAADQLATVAAGAPWRHQFLGAPMLFLYRHYIELHLKSLLVDAGELLDDPQSVPPEHYIKTLWKRFRALLLEISDQEEDPWLARADDIVSQFDELDPKSFTFRYPVSRKGVPSLEQALVVDASNVRRIVAELHVLLSGASAQIDLYTGIKREMRGVE